MAASLEGAPASRPSDGKVASAAGLSWIFEMMELSVAP